MYISEWKLWFGLVSIVAMAYCIAKGWYMKGYSEGFLWGNQKKVKGKKLFHDVAKQYEGAYASWWAITFFIGLTLLVVSWQE